MVIIILLLKRKNREKDEVHGMRLFRRYDKDSNDTKVPFPFSNIIMGTTFAWAISQYIGINFGNV